MTEGMREHAWPTRILRPIGNCTQMTATASDVFTLPIQVWLVKAAAGGNHQRTHVPPSPEAGPFNRRI